MLFIFQHVIISYFQIFSELKKKLTDFDQKTSLTDFTEFGQNWFKL